MRVVLISDTHGKHRDIKLPKGDILIHAGDMTNVGELVQFEDFNKWMGEQDFEHKIAVAGNHDTSLDLPADEVLCGQTRRSPLRIVGIGTREEWRNKIIPLFTNFVYLENSGVVVDGLNIWGSPYTPFFASDFWRFYTRSGAERSRMWAKIPEGLDVLITHGPPRGILDMTMEKVEAGDLELHDRVRRLMKNPPKVHVFGHIHEGYGTMKIESSIRKTQFINASVATRSYAMTNPPLVWDTELDIIER